MYTTRRPGLGLNTSALISQGAGMASDLFVPGSSALVTPVVNTLTSVFHIRAGANEADKIVPVQNEIAEGLGQVDQILASSVSIPQLQATFETVQTWARDFHTFITSADFRDGRASEQAANTLMPLIDGTGNYTWPDMQGHIVSVDKWGNPTNGGRLGSLARKIIALGGGSMPPQITQAGSMGPSLNFMTPGSSYLPQAGWLPPTSPLSQIQTADFSIGSVDGGGYTLPLLVVAGLFFLSGGGRRARR